MSNKIEIMRYLKRKPNMVRKFIKVYNNLCYNCSILCRENPRRPYEDYCHKCKKMFEEVLGHGTVL